MRRTTAYDGDAFVSPNGKNGKKFRVWIEAPNVTAETYITRRRARTILDSLAFHLGYELHRKPPGPDSIEEER